MSRRQRKSDDDTLKTGAYYQQSRASGRLIPLLAVLVTLGFLGFVVYDSLASDSGFQQIEKLEIELEQARARLQNLEDEALRLQESIHQLENDPTAVEAVAREQLGFIKPGERVFLLDQVPEVPIAK